MRDRFSVAILVALALVSLSSQTRPDFSGRWIAVEPSSLAGHELTITQDGSTLRLEQVRLQSRQTYDNMGRRVMLDGERESTSYRLDGQPTTTSRSPGDGQPVRSSLRWDGERAVLTDLYPATGLRFERMLRADEKGRLILEQRRPEVTSEDPAISSAGILEPTRLVFEKR